MAAQNFAPVLVPVYIDITTGVVSNYSPDLSGTVPLPANNSVGLAVVRSNNRGDTESNGADLIAERVWNAVWNDYADFQLLNDELIPGKCYMDTADGAKICTQRCQLSVIGIASDSFGHAVGLRADQVQVPIAVAGWALAYVDQEYPCGTPLTNDENGNLTEMTLEEKRDFPERLIAIYKKKEVQTEFGPNQNNKIQVNGRHWVKIK